MISFTYNPGPDKALVIIDVQNDFVTGSLGSEYAEKVVVPNILELCKKFPIPHIYATQDTHYPDYKETLEGQKLPVYHCLAGTKGHNLIPEIEEIIKSNPTSDRNVFLKSTFGVYPDTLLNTFGGFDEIHICGLCTDICVVSNALILRALFPNKPIYVHANCCGGTSKEAHDAALTVMKSCQIDVISE